LPSRPASERRYRRTRACRTRGQRCPVGPAPRVGRAWVGSRVTAVATGCRREAPGRSSWNGGPMTYDLVIRNGTVVDGSGLARYRADVGVDGDTIVAIGRIRERGRAEVDADGHVVTPGFVDGHTHMDAQVFWDPLGSCSSYHGVTSVVMGNCGFSLAPAPEAQRGLVVRNLERAEDISGTAMAEGIKWTW